ncbi:MAG: histidine kinase, partial [Acidobacteria bacterium]|nr:histidine kinase [Acidobacteriota bacterium]
MPGIPQDLMRHRVQHILLVSSLYDSFILAEDGRLQEVILSEFLELNLRHAPGLTHVATGSEALTRLTADRRDRPAYDLVITAPQVGDMDALALARRVRETGLSVPVVLLAYDYQDLNEFRARADLSDFDRIFLWQGNVRILLAIVKDVEDRLNVEHDTGRCGVQAIILIEDSVRYYSSFLPAAYIELMKQSARLVPEGINLWDKMMRIEARPKILLCGTYEEAWQYFERYHDNVLGIISDVEFPMCGKKRNDAGLLLTRHVRERDPDVPVMLQSGYLGNEFLARAAGASFVQKGSPFLLEQLGHFMVDNFAFGDFVFRLPDGTEVDRATDLRSLEEKLRTVPEASLAYHGERNHFSKWLKARTEFTLADRLRPRRVSEFATVEALRQELIRSIQDYRRERGRTTVADFDRHTFDAETSFARIGGGSLGGKARGLAFVNRLLSDYRTRDGRTLAAQFPGIQISVPSSIVLGTDVFDEFLETNDLKLLAIGSRDDRQVHQAFQLSRLPRAIMNDLTSALELIRYPLAIRSSSLLEDSHYRPFAGIYATYMLPNTHVDLEVRLQQLTEAILRVYASTFSQRAKAYLEGSPYRLEEEKMAVIIQRLVGMPHGRRFYPDFAGVARSHNFYPSPPMKAEDGIAAVALGLGAAVVEGNLCVRFSPRYPRHALPSAAPGIVMRDSQREFYALELPDPDDPRPALDVDLKLFGLEDAMSDGTLPALASTYSPENDAIYDGTSRPGVPLVTFAPVLKHGQFPLAALVEMVLDVGTRGTTGTVEIEFAVNLSAPRGSPREFAFLQLRPLPQARVRTGLDLGQVDPARLLCRSGSVLGNGIIDNVRDLIVVDYHRFERGRSLEVAREVARLNAQLWSEI